MIYGSGDFIGYPWEVVTKTFREHIGDTVFSTVSECGDKFLTYLSSDKFENENLENLNILSFFGDVIGDIKNRIGDQTSTKLDYKRRITKTINERIESAENNFKKLEGQIKKSVFLGEYLETIKDNAEDILKLKITKKLQKLIADFLYLLFRSQFESSLSTGVVLTGYGKSQLFPELIDYKIDGKHKGFVRFWVTRKFDLNEKDTSDAMVVPFAQSDMFQLFMAGITNNHLTFVRDILIRVLNHKSTRLIEKFVDGASKRRAEKESQKKDNKEIIIKFFEEFSSYMQKEMIQPVVTVISTLPKEEMAAMAEALVEITTLRRKVDSPIESVGGPTDVAIISKGDGLIWIKRKHYFDIEINRDFLRRKTLNHGGVDASQSEG